MDILNLHVELLHDDIKLLIIFDRYFIHVHYFMRKKYVFSINFK